MAWRSTMNAFRVFSTARWHMKTTKKYRPASGMVVADYLRERQGDWI